MEAKFTKGQWWVKDNGTHWNNPNISNYQICYSRLEECVVDHVYELADAHLIAAAPEMYEMLKHLSELNGYELAGFMENSSDVIDLLAKARGEL